MPPLVFIKLFNCEYEGINVLRSVNAVKFHVGEAFGNEVFDCRTDILVGIPAEESIQQSFTDVFQGKAVQYQKSTGYVSHPAPGR